MESNITIVSSLDLPELQPYRTLRRPLEHIQQGIFVAEGSKVVERLLASPLEIVSILMTHEWHSYLSSIQNLKSKFQHIEHIFIAEKQILESIVGYNLHQGIMAVARVPSHPTLAEMLGTLREPRLLVALDGLVNSENIGVIVRNCAAFGVDGIIVGETSSSPYLRRAVRNSMGTVFSMPVVHVSNLAESLNELRNKHQTEVVAAHPHDEATIHSSNFNNNCCIVFGHEGLGVSQQILNVCTRRVAIPMENNTDSLNVASASAVFLYEARKQRAMNKEFHDSGLRSQASN